VRRLIPGRLETADAVLSRAEQASPTSVTPALGDGKPRGITWVCCWDFSLPGEATGLLLFSDSLALMRLSFPSGCWAFPPSPNQVLFFHFSTVLIAHDNLPRLCPACACSMCSLLSLTHSISLALDSPSASGGDPRVDSDAAKAKLMLSENISSWRIFLPQKNKGKKKRKNPSSKPSVSISHLNRFTSVCVTMLQFIGKDK